MNKINNPVCCVLGHVDVGKTKLLDKLRKSNIQSKEIGGITQQIGSTYFDKKILKNLTKSINKTDLEISGLIMIDTPGHDCFTQMRMTGVKISHIAIIVVDVIKGLEKQTIQCIELLKENNTHFMIALNKIDKIYGWNPQKDVCLKQTFEKQTKQTLTLLKDYINKIIIQLAELEINAMVYYENKNPKEFISMVPISASTGEGIADLIMVISKLTTNNLISTNIYNNLKKYNYGFILDIKRDEKIGLIYHSILVNGEIEKGNEIIIEGKEDSQYIKNTIKEIYVPNNQVEMKSKTQLIPTDKIIDSKGLALKFLDNDIGCNIGGIFIVKKQNEDINELETTMSKIIKKNITEYKFDKKGIIINVPSKSMADAVIQILKEKKDIKIMHINIGTINKPLITKVANVINKYDRASIEYLYNKRFATILDYNSAFESIITNDIYDLEIINFAREQDIKIINANIIYKLFDEYNDYINELNNKIKQLYPNISKNFELEIIPKYIFLKKTPLLFGVKILKGKITKNLFVMANNNGKSILLGKITGIQKNNKNIDEVDNGEICIKIESDQNIEYGKDFDDKWKLYHYMDQSEKIILEKYKEIFS